MRSESKSDSAKTPLRVWIFYKNMGADFAGVELFGTGPKFKGKNTSSAALLNVPDKKKLWCSRADTAKMTAKNAIPVS